MNMESILYNLNVSVAKQTAHEEYQVFLTADQFFLYFKVSLLPYYITAFCGVFGNIVNIRTFSILGLKDGVTVCFFLLSISDFMLVLSFCLMILGHTFAILEQEAFTWFELDPFLFIFFAGNSIRVFAYMGMFNITFISIARCLCVAMPLKFKQLFTTTRSWVIVITSNVLIIASNAPNFANMGSQKVFDEINNKTRIVMWFSPQREQIKDIIWFIFEMLLPTIVEIILIVCTIVMSIKLRASANFRSKTGNQEETSSKSNVAKMSNRELRIIYQVILIATVYIVFTVIKIFNSLYKSYHPDFDNGKPNQYFYLVVNNFIVSCDAINASLNFIIYYNFNSAFRTNL